jgi:TonB family protein
VEAQSQKQVKSNPVKEGPHDPVIRGYNRAAVPLIIDPDKVDDYLAERSAYDVVEQMPSFPGGTQKLKEFIEENLRYPKELEESCVQGRVIVRFIVERNGKLSNVKVVKSVHPVLDKEALRIVNLMPNWIPGKQNGRTVRVKFLIPITFRLK